MKIHCTYVRTYAGNGMCEQNLNVVVMLSFLFLLANKYAPYVDYNANLYFLSEIRTYIHSTISTF